VPGSMQIRYWGLIVNRRARKLLYSRVSARREKKPALTFGPASSEENRTLVYSERSLPISESRFEDLSQPLDRIWIRPPRSITK